jgi:hypothetical protein
MEDGGPFCDSPCGGRSPREPGPRVGRHAEVGARTVKAIRISYQPRLADVLHGARLAEGEAWKTMSRVAAILLVLLGGVFVYWGFPGWAGVWFAVAIAEWFNLLPLSVVVAYFEFRRNPKYRQRYELTLSPEALYVTTDTVSSIIKWDHFSHLWDTSKAFVLCSGVGIPAVIPKAAFTNAVDLEAARTLLVMAVKERSAHGQSAA